MRASIRENLKIRGAGCTAACRPRKFSSNFHSMPPVSGLWISAGPIAYPIRGEPAAPYVRNVRAALRAGCQEPGGDWASSVDCCRASALACNTRAVVDDLHSKVTNAVFYLANIGSAFVTFESRLTASFGSGGVEASLAGKAPQSWSGAVSPPASTARSMTLSARFSVERRRCTLKFSAYRNHRSTSAHPRAEGVGSDSCREV